MQARTEPVPITEIICSMELLEAMPETVRNRLKNAGLISPTGEREHDRAFFERQAAAENQKTGNLPYYDCQKCGNKGYIAVVHAGWRGQGFEISRPNCDCMIKRRYLRNVRESGLSEALTRYTLEAWHCREPWQQELLDAVKRYADNPEGWFCLTGTTGTGKTHLCTALCGILLEKGYPVRYMLWRDIATRAKAAVTDNEAYAEIVEPLKRVRVLYIDDFWKTGRAANHVSGQVRPTVGDLNLAFELLNARYADSNLLTIISTEMNLYTMLSTDEAIGSRIAERTRGGRYYDLSGYKNWRLIG